MEWLGKTLDFISKYSWAVMVVSAFVLFVPDDAAKQIAVLDIRDNYKGIWWIVLVLSAAIWSSAVFRYFDSKVSVWLQSRAKERERIEKQEKRKAAIRARLDSLDDKELLWIKYCLYHNTQTLSAQRGDRVAQSLTYKGILAEGSGHILDLPFHIPDDVWEYLKENQSLFLPESDRRNPKFEQILEQFRRGRHASF
jgi:Super-infection exclusion protein B